MASLAKVNNSRWRRPLAFIYRSLKQLSFDYRDALVETGKKMVERPFKTIVYSSSIFLLTYAYRTMPSFSSYTHDLINFQQQQMLTSSLVRSRRVEIYLDTIEQLMLREQLHFVDCYLFSLIIYKHRLCSTENRFKLYENVCSYLNVRTEARLVDVGAFNRWFMLNQHSRRADVFDDDEKAAS